MGLQGSLDTMSLPDLLQWLGGAQKTGTVTLTQGGTSKRIFVENGLVTGSASNDPSEFLGQFLLSYGRITEEQLRDALSSKQGSPEYLGAHLMRMGALNEVELTRMLALKTEETIYSLFHWEKAHFEFFDSEAANNPFPVALRVDDVLLKGARRYDELCRVREVIPSSACVPQRTSTPLPLALLRGPHLKRLAEAVDGQRSVAAIALHTHTSEFLVCKFLFELLKTGMIEILPAEALAAAPPSAQAAPAPPAAEVVPDLYLTAVKLFEAGDYGAVLTLTDSARSMGSESLQGLIRRAEERFTERAYEHYLPASCIPTLIRAPKDLLNEKLSTEEYFIISRIDGTWDVRSIIAVSPLREIDAIRVLLRLRERGLVTLAAAVGSART